MPVNQPRKQARQARSRATQEAIVEAAARILEKQGRAAVTTNAIALCAGVSIGSLYQYFPNKNAILAAVLRRTRDELLDLMHNALKDADQVPPETAIDRLIRAAMAHQFGRPKLALELEYLEPHLADIEESTSLAGDISTLILGTIRRIRPEAGEQEAQDVVSIGKALINADALGGGAGGADLHDRCLRGVLGYLKYLA